MVIQANFAPYEPASETWDMYVEHFDCFLQANDFTELSSNRKRAHFLNACGLQIFAMAKALAAPQTVSTVPWAILMGKLKAHYVPASSHMSQRFTFRQRVQKEGESIHSYMASLRTAAIDCEFPNLDDSLLEQLVCGVRDARLQCRLLAKNDISLQSALDEACAYEMSEKSSAETHRAPSSLATARSAAVHHDDVFSDDPTDEEDDVSRLKSSPRGKRQTERKPQQAPCLGCGENHPRSLCHFKTAVCR